MQSEREVKMKAKERQTAIANKLLSAKEAVSGKSLSEEFGVSRQIIVQDIANLKVKGFDIVSTHNGYLILQSPLHERILKLKHSKDETEEELKTIVECGGTVVNVFVWHKVYGKLEADLNISTMFHIEKFLDGVRSGKSTELMNITGGYHYHTIRAESKEALDRIETILSEKNFIAPEI